MPTVGPIISDRSTIVLIVADAFTVCLLLTDVSTVGLLVADVSAHFFFVIADVLYSRSSCCRYFYWIDCLRCFSEMTQETVNRRNS